jgi:hypothetical protein
MSDGAAEQLLAHGHAVLCDRMRAALRNAGAEDEGLEELVWRAAQQADAVQWRGVLASCAAEQLGIDVGEALRHPLVAAALRLTGALSPEGEERAGVALSARHLAGIAELERDEQIEIGLTASDLLLERTGGDAVGRIGWNELRDLQAAQRRRGLRRRTVLIVRTRDGEAVFETPQLSVRELRERVQAFLTQRPR